MKATSGNHTTWGGLDARRGCNNQKSRVDTKLGAKLLTLWFLVGFAFFSAAVQADAATDVYYSIGTSTADLKTGSPTIIISSGIATLSVAQTGNIGVGDVITYRGISQKAYIKSVVNNTTFVVQTATGGTPTNYSDTVTTIKRVFNDVATAESSSPGSSYLTTSNLVTGEKTLTWVCYNDGPFNVSSQTTISGWTTDSTRYLTLTVAGASQVASGISQRHKGIAGTGAIMRATGGTDYAILGVNQAYTRVEWLELDGNEIVDVGGFYIQSNADYSLYSQLIIHNMDGTNLSANAFALDAGADNVQIRNVIAYYLDGDGIYTSGTNLSIYNCTFYYGRTSPQSNSIQVAGGSTTAYNVIGAGQEMDFYSSASLTLYNCMSEDGSAGSYGGSGNLTYKTASNQFNSISGTIDLHLKAGSDAINAGFNLSATFTDDIDGQARAGTWDIGADEIPTNLNSLDPLLAYTDAAAVDTIRYSTYTTSWSAEATGPDANDNNLVFHVAKTGPGGREHVVLAASYDNKVLYAFLYNGSSWTTKNLGTVYTTDSRCFNAAYEHASGDLVIVASTTTSNQIKYWVWNGSSWVVDGETYTFTTINRNISWVRMASQPGTNQVALVVSATQYYDVAGLIWDGNVNSWGNEKKLGSATSDDPEAIGVEYMQASTYAGQALFVWGQSTTLRSWTWTGAAWEGVAKSKPSFSGSIRWISLAADPSSDDMLVAVWAETANDLQTINWTGSAWGTIQSPETTSLYGSIFGNKPFDVIFESASSHAILAYTDDSGLRYRHTSNIAAAWDAEAYLDSVNTTNIDCYWVELGRTTGGTIHVACQDNVDGTYDALLAYSWDGSSWSAQTIIESTIYKGPSNHDYKAFGLSIQPPATSVVLNQSHYRWRNDDGAEAAATFALAEDSKLGIAKNTIKRLRFLVANMGTGGSTAAYQLQSATTESCGAGTYSVVPTNTSGHWQIIGSSYFGDGDASTNVSSGLTDPSGAAFTAGQLKDTGTTTGSLTLYSNRFTEIEFAIQATSNATAGGDYCFQLYNSTSGAVLNGYTYAQARVLGVTAINLLSFEAQGDGEAVRVIWQTAQETENKGFNLYRAQSPAGPYVQLNAKLIASQSIRWRGPRLRVHGYTSQPGRDLLLQTGGRGCIGHAHPKRSGVRGLGRGRDAGRLGDCLRAEPGGERRQPRQRRGRGGRTWLEYARGTDPFNRDTDGDGVADGAEKKNPGYSGGSGSSLSADREGAGAGLGCPGDDA